MIVGIMGAMPEEIEIVLSHMKQVTQITHGNRQYYKGKINNIAVVLTFSYYGKVAASITAMSLITVFNVEKIIFTGVAGACAANLNIGDVVISQNTYQHDMDATPLFPKHEIPLTGKTFSIADPMLLNQAKKSSSTFLASIDTTIPKTILDEFHITQPQCYVGTIASGDQFIASKTQIEQILSDKPETLAVEMEGAAVGQVCYDHKIPFVIIRTISDQANQDASIDFLKFIKNVAQCYAEYIILNMMGLLAEEKQTTVEAIC